MRNAGQRLTRTVLTKLGNFTVFGPSTALQSIAADTALADGVVTGFRQNSVPLGQA